MTLGPCGKQLAARPVPMVRKRPAAAMGGQTPADLGPVWKWRCEVGHQASCLGVDAPDRRGREVNAPELLEALPTVESTASSVAAGGSARNLRAEFVMPPHASHIATYAVEAQVLEARVSAFGPEEPGPDHGSGPAPPDGQAPTGGASGGELPRPCRKRPAAAG